MLIYFFTNRENKRDLTSALIGCKIFFRIVCTNGSIFEGLNKGTTDATQAELMNHRE